MADADGVMVLYRDDYYGADSERPGEMDIIVRKNRQGRLGHVTTRIDSRLRYLPSSRDRPSGRDPASLPPTPAPAGDAVLGSHAPIWTTESGGPPASGSSGDRAHGEMTDSAGVMSYAGRRG
ncbi:MAG: DnaB-like helicase C-terminal domain-containing protein, partial [Solirubrobacteraceae bacterium]